MAKLALVFGLLFVVVSVYAHENHENKRHHAPPADAKRAAHGHAHAEVRSHGHHDNKRHHAEKHGEAKRVHSARHGQAHPELRHAHHQSRHAHGHAANKRHGHHFDSRHHNTFKNILDRHGNHHQLREINPANLGVPEGASQPVCYQYCYWKEDGVPSFPGFPSVNEDISSSGSVDNSVDYVDDSTDNTEEVIDPNPSSTPTDSTYVTSSDVPTDVNSTEGSTTDIYKRHGKFRGRHASRHHNNLHNRHANPNHGQEKRRH